MSRPIRTRRLPKKFDNESCDSGTKTVPIKQKQSPAVKGAVKSSRGRDTKKKKEEVTSRASALRDKTNTSNEMSKSTVKDDATKEKNSIEHPESIKRSSRLKGEKSRGVNEKKESISGKNSSLRYESGVIRKRNGLGRENESQENDLDNGKAGSDPKTTQNKFFKSKKLGCNNGPRILPGRRAAANKKSAKTNDKQLKKKGSLDCTVSFRQTTLSESFGQGSLRARLRPRKNAKDYKDLSNISTLLENSISPDKRKSFILLERLDKPKANRQPVYKAVDKLDHKNTDDKDSVYDFQFDYNDPGEKPARNKIGRKKRVTKKPTAVKKARKTVPLPERNINKPEKPEKDPVPSQSEEKPTNDDKLKTLPSEIKNAMETEPEKVVKPQEAPVSHQKPTAEENSEEKAPRARICSVETLTGDRKVSFKAILSPSRQNSAKFNPFRSTQSIFKPRSTLNAKTMMDHSLLNKSLSPIKGDLEPFDLASPWRPPLPNSFSRVKKVVQSTPQADRSLARTAQSCRIDENDENDENEENTRAKVAPLLKLGSKRMLNPLGVRISNAENIQASNSKKNELLLAAEANAKLALAKKPLGLAPNYGDNKKQNSGFADRLYKSPKKNEKATVSIGSPGLKKWNNPLSSREEYSVIQNEENFPPAEEIKLLKQSNLNTFLNIDEMPESIRINTSHGIFGEENSAALIVRSQTPKITMQANIENCFGFDEDCQFEVQDSPKKLDKKQEGTPVNKIFQRLKRRVMPKKKKQGTARISLGEIKNTLYPRKEQLLEKVECKDEKNRKRGLELEVDKDPRSRRADSKSKNIANPLQFSDTFDVLSESGQAEDQEKSTCDEIALFADLEPVHFTKPPRWSYAKKRDRKQYWSSDEDDNDDADIREEPVLKKRKLVKLNKVEEKKIDEWVKSVNETFQEIDDFDLVVEKLS